MSLAGPYFLAVLATELIPRLVPVKLLLVRWLLSAYYFHHYLFTATTAHRVIIEVSIQFPSFQVTPQAPDKPSVTTVRGSPCSISQTRQILPRPLALRALSRPVHTCSAAL